MNKLAEALTAKVPSRIRIQDKQSIKAFSQAIACGFSVSELGGIPKELIENPQAMIEDYRYEDLASPENRVGAMAQSDLNRINESNRAKREARRLKSANIKAWINESNYAWHEVG